MENISRKEIKSYEVIHSFNCDRCGKHLRDLAEWHNGFCYAPKEFIWTNRLFKNCNEDIVLCDECKEYMDNKIKEVTKNVIDEFHVNEELKAALLKLYC